jgi:hypothetical protein
MTAMQTYNRMLNLCLSAASHHMYGDEYITLYCYITSVTDLLENRDVDNVAIGVLSNENISPDVSHANCRTLLMYRQIPPDGDVVSMLMDIKEALEETLVELIDEAQDMIDAREVYDIDYDYI